MTCEFSNQSVFSSVIYRQYSIKNNLIKRSKIIQAIRNFFTNNEYIEIETPNRIPQPTPEAFIEAIESYGWFLHTSPEQCMKRLLAAGYDKIFQICKCYRGGERSSLHLPEFTMLEWYQKGFDYFKIMQECEDMVLYVLNELNSGLKINYQNKIIDFSKPWKRLGVKEAFEKYCSKPFDEIIENDQFDEAIINEIEPGLSNIDSPVFLYDYPESRSALSKLKESDNSLAQRFELYIAGIELANAFTELTDSNIQLDRFKKENIIREKIGKNIYTIPEKFIESLKFMPDSAGIAFGIDRFVMILCNLNDIDLTVSFIPEEL